MQRTVKFSRSRTFRTTAANTRVARKNKITRVRVAFARSLPERDILSAVSRGGETVFFQTLCVSELVHFFFYAAQSTSGTVSNRRLAIVSKHTCAAGVPQGSVKCQRYCNYLATSNIINRPQRLKTYRPQSTTCRTRRRTGRRDGRNQDQ